MTPSPSETRQKLMNKAWAYGSLCIAAILLLAAVQFFINNLRQTGADLMSPNGFAIGGDYLSLWSAGWLALNGHAADAYNADTILAAHKIGVPANTALTLFHYPPSFTLMLVPFSMLPYIQSLFAFNAITLGLALFALWKLRPHWTTLLFFMGYPPLWLNILSGQNACLSLALLAFGISYLEKNPKLSGICIGLLSFKPQLGLAIPVALIANHRWKQIGWASATVLILAILSALLLGIDSWKAFLENIRKPFEVLEDGRIPLERMASAFSAVRLHGGSIQLAYIAQLSGMIAAFIGLSAIWKLKGTPLPLKGAALGLSVLLSTPHLFHYDMTLLAIPLILFLRHGEEQGWQKGERLLLMISYVAMPAFLGLSSNNQLSLYPYLLLSLLCLALIKAQKTKHNKLLC